MSLLLLFRPRNTGFVPSPIATITVGSLDETQIRAGGQTIVITLANDTFVTQPAFQAERQNIINGLLSAQAEALGWNNVVRALQGVAGVVRTSDTKVTITLDAQATYDITVLETITVSVPHTALNVSLVNLVATPTFNVTPIAVVAATQQTGVKKRQIRVRRADFSSQANYEFALRAAMLNADFATIEHEPEVQRTKPKPKKIVVTDTAIKVSAEAMAKLQAASEMDEMELIQLFIQIIDEDLA